MRICTFVRTSWCSRVRQSHTACRRFVQLVLLWAHFVEVLANIYDSEKGTDQHPYGNFKLYQRMFSLLRMLWAATNACGAGTAGPGCGV